MYLLNGLRTMLLWNLALQYTGKNREKISGKYFSRNFPIFVLKMGELHFPMIVPIVWGHCDSLADQPAYNGNTHNAGNSQASNMLYVIYQCV